jgi:UDP-N-acetylglucosamine 2-epimerase (non-hydrolysing)
MSVPASVLFIFGTRPEAIKLCPVIRYVREHTSLDVRVCVTAQHREMLDQVLAVFHIVPDFDLSVMRPGQTLTEATSRILAGLEPVIAAVKPSFVVVQGDTTSTLCGALAAFYARVPVAHVEAGLRTGDPAEPFPEEMNRLLVTRLSDLHFAATREAAQNLTAEGIASCKIHITGNTGIDAVLHVAGQLECGAIVSDNDWTSLADAGRKLIVVTAHRRESFGEGFARICAALREIADRPDVRIVYPVHPNPNVSGPVRRELGNHPNVTLTDPLDYVSFVDLMRRSWLMLTDSGGIQEEAPSLGKPVLVMRNKTERPEAVEAGTSELVGTDVCRIVSAVNRLLNDPGEYGRRARIHNPYGDGRSGERISAVLTGRLLAAG